MRQRILINLDSLIDTRLTTLFRLDTSIIDNFDYAKWRNRETKEISIFSQQISQAQYEEAYAKRDIEDLIYGLPTSLNFNLMDVIGELESNLINNSPEVMDIEIEVNVYPYDLSDEEKQQIAYAVSARCGLVQFAKCVSIPESYLVPAYLKAEGYTLLILDDLDRYIKETILHEDKEIVGSPQTAIFVPKLAFSQEKLDEVKQYPNPEGLIADPFDVTHSIFASLFSIYFIPVYQYCVHDLTETLIHDTDELYHTLTELEESGKLP